MTRRETRVVNAFVNCVKSGEFTEDYAITLIEDNQRYGWMSEEAKEAFYTALDAMAAEAEKAETVVEPEEPTEPVEETQTE